MCHPRLVITLVLLFGLLSASFRHDSTTPHHEIKYSELLQSACALLLHLCPYCLNGQRPDPDNCLAAPERSFLLIVGVARRLVELANCASVVKPNWSKWRQLQYNDNGVSHFCWHGISVVSVHCRSVYKVELLNRFCALS